MAREVVEVVARFAGTIIDVAHLGPHDRYSVGTAPGVDLAVPGLTCFPLVDRGVVRCPIGMQAHDAETSERGPEPTEIRAGALSLRVTRTQIPQRTLPAPRVELRTPAFVLASLLTHLAIWLAAERFAPFERLVAPRVPLRLARVTVAVDPPPPPPRAAPKPAPHEKAAPPRRAALANAAHAVRGARREHPDEATALDPSAAIAQMLDRMPDLESPEYADAFDAEHFHDPGSEDNGSFGTSLRFDPAQRDGFASVKTGAYATLPPGVTLCPAGACTVDGPIPPLYVRTHLLAHIEAIYECYETLAPGPGTIVLEFTITADGAVRDARGSGLGETGACAARVASDIFFRALGRETHVRYPVQFRSPG